MMIDAVIAVAQRCEVTTFDSLFKRRFQSFRVREEIERLDVLWFLLEFGFGKPPRLACEIAKLSHDLRVYFVAAAGVERFGAVKGALQPARLVKRLDPDARGEQLITAGMIRDQFDDLFE